MAYPQDAPHYHGRVVTVNPSTGRYTGLTAADPLYVSWLGSGSPLGGFTAVALDPAGTGNLFETDQAVTDTPTLYVTASSAVTNVVIDRIHVNLNPTNAVVPNLYLFAGADADNLTSESLMIFSSLDYVPNGLVDATEYDFVDLVIPATLATAGRIYYLLDWTGAPGDTLGYLKVFGRGV